MTGQEEQELDSRLRGNDEKKQKRAKREEEMSNTPSSASITRRAFLGRIGTVSGAAAMYQAMTTLGFAAESSYSGPIQLKGAPRDSSILILGAGLAGLVAAYELSRAGYKVKVLEYNHRAGGRAWTIRGGDEYTELGGFKQKCEFDKDLYFNPGPWRIPYHHHGVLDYARRLKVPLQSFTEVNHNALLHSSKAFGGKPQRYRHVRSDFKGHVAELLAKSLDQGGLDATLSHEDKEKMLEAMRSWGILDKQYRYVASHAVDGSRGYKIDPGGGLMAKPESSTPLDPKELIDSGLWKYLVTDHDYEMGQALFQPAGGMDRIAQALYKEVAPLVQFGAKVVKIDQDDHGVAVSYVDAAKGGEPVVAKADWCLCTIPLSILSQIPLRAGEPMKAAISAAAAYVASTKIGLQFKRRFWEEDERIYGGVSYTDLPITMISYPMDGQNLSGKGVLLGAYAFGPNAYTFASLDPAQRVREAVRLGAQIHPQYPAEFENGVSVAWHRSPFTLGCFAPWPGDTREKHYDNLCAIDGRIALAGEHASRLPAWQEGAVLSSLDAISRMHARITSAGQEKKNG
jgi:monoamine oxidase